MTQYDVKRLALVLALNADVEGMKAENMNRERRGEAMAYNDADFHALAEQLRELAYRHDEQL